MSSGRVPEIRARSPSAGNSTPVLSLEQEWAGPQELGPPGAWRQDGDQDPSLTLRSQAAITSRTGAVWGRPGSVETTLWASRAGRYQSSSLPSLEPEEPSLQPCLGGGAQLGGSAISPRDWVAEDAKGRLGGGIPAAATGGASAEGGAGFVTLPSRPRAGAPTFPRRPCWSPSRFKGLQPLQHVQHVQPGAWARPVVWG